MRLEDIAVAVRPRSGWDAIDLGLRMYQQWWRNLILPWCTFVIPVMLLVVFFLHEHLFWCMVVLWWLKPLYSRFALHVFSRNLFGDTPQLSSARRILVSLYFMHLVKLLTIYRFDPARSFNLPVWQLEGLKGKARRERSRILQQRSYNPAVNLTLVSLVFEAAVFMSFIGLFYMLLPFSGDVVSGATSDDALPSWAIDLLFLTAQILTYSLIEPIYTAGGFSLYINRRTILEAWDIELAFRRISNRLASQIGSKVAMMALIISTLAGAIPQPGLAKASSPDSALAFNRSEARVLIQDVLNDPVFGENKEVHGWFPKELEETDEEPSPSPWWEFLAPVMQFVARLIGVLGQAVLWIAVAIGVFLFILLVARYGGAMPRRRRARTRRIAAPTTLFGMSVSPESLPKDVAGHARQLINRGEMRSAMSLLYRASLSHLVHDFHLPLNDSATEGDCVRAVRSEATALPESTQRFFEYLTRLWQFTAYARKRSGERELLAVCDAWPQHFDRVV